MSATFWCLGRGKSAIARDHRSQGALGSGVPQCLGRTEYWSPQCMLRTPTTDLWAQALAALSRLRNEKNRAAVPVELPFQVVRFASNSWTLFGCKVINLH